MVDKERLINELKEKFEETKKELGFSASLEEINNVFYVEDAIISEGYVSNNFDRQLCSRMVTTFYSWMNELHAWFMPPPGNVIVHTEVKGLDEKDKETVKYLIKKGMYFYRADKINGINHDKKAMGLLVDQMVSEGKDFFDKLKIILEKSRDVWKKELDKK